MDTTAAPPTPIAVPARNRLRGLLFALAGSCLWGLSGVAAQVLFRDNGISPQQLVTVRMLGAGALLVVLARPSFPRRHPLAVALFGVFGLAAVQLTFLAAIVAMNVALATFLQYLSIPLIALYEVVVARRPLTRGRALSLGAALLGISLLVLGGAQGVAAGGITALGLVFGVLSALTAAFYTLLSVPLVREVGALRSTTWGMLFGGVVVGAWAPPWSIHPSGDIPTVALLLAFIVVFGTLAAFVLFISSLAHLSATEASIVVTVEPVTAALAAFLWLHVVLSPIQYVGGAAILVAVLLLRRR